jgi:hypothetical protein
MDFVNLNLLLVGASTFSLLCNDIRSNKLTGRVSTYYLFMPTHLMTAKW